ncbi:hypothetical protein EYZ11_009625 [Aspergillus tanneri]|uniref:Uncharacterized protein n=1 Tax=Aspergillus tanneri TaxID=1220188 RepID=A0A4S3J9I1_9EURO|nr:hypothetical protein EYZ11_009625 [Aspergillus tanneri]
MPMTGICPSTVEISTASRQFVGLGGWVSRYVAELTANGTLSTFGHLVVVDYGRNVPISESEEMFSDEFLDSYPPYNPTQFMAWFCLPTLRYLNIWLPDIDWLRESNPDLDFNSLETLILPALLLLKRTADDHFQESSHWVLHSFPNLQTAEMPLFVLLGCDLLHCFFVNWHIYTPELNQITKRNWDQNHTDFRKDQEERLRVACAEAG